MIKKIKGKYAVFSETTGRKFGTYNTLEEAKRRLRQVEYFKHLSKSKRRKALSNWQQMPNPAPILPS